MPNYLIIQHDKEKEKKRKMDSDYLLMQMKKKQSPVKSDMKLYDEDKEFYKKRILDLTKRLLKNDIPKDCSSNVQNIHYQYIVSCIEYFKMTDTCDFIQQETGNTGLTQSDSPVQEVEEVPKAEDIYKKLFLQNPTQNLQLFIVRNPSEKKPKPTALDIRPLQKNYDLKSPELKIKGIKKKEIKEKDKNEDAEKKPGTKKEEDPK